MDLNLLVALDALLAEESVSRAAARLGTSAPAMSRTLARIRRVCGDPILVRAGRTLVPTPRALELREEVSAIVARARGLLSPVPGSPLTRRFTLRVGDALLAVLAAPLLSAVRASEPGVDLRFVSDSLEGAPALRDGLVDLEVGTLDNADHDASTRVEPLLETRYVAAVRPAHPLARLGRVTPGAFAAVDHIGISRRGRVHGPIDDRLRALGLRRRIAVVVPSYPAALLLARESDLVCPAPAGLSVLDLMGLRTFEIPLDLPPATIAMAWHPRDEGDRAHRWLRDQVRSAVAELV
ncbi:LysR family transcriptional regulator [Actinokineospora enzanensis]|uniref:LysR family transcriptional regulator n=1 Tax=Actinokineospora enzanensis TaxID=155975 RepID=UPI00038041D5|nr:LysR family transcriptional regulator [Actinokineospora enzanensis]